MIELTWFIIRIKSDNYNAQKPVETINAVITDTDCSAQISHIDRPKAWANAWPFRLWTTINSALTGVKKEQWLWVSPYFCLTFFCLQNNLKSYFLILFIHSSNAISPLHLDLKAPFEKSRHSFQWLIYDFLSSCDNTGRRTRCFLCDKQNIFF